jgi:hypothetical protein
MDQNAYQIRRTFLTGLSHGEDLLSQVETIVKTQAVPMAALSVIGAVSSAAFGYYDQKERYYKKICRNGAHEIVSCYGNVSLKDGQSMVHAHILIGDEEGRTFGGHLMSPTIIFAAELHMQELEGQQLNRAFDETTGLYLWSK